MATKTITEKNTLVKLDNPAALKKFSIDLASFINENKLAAIIGDKKYVFVEGWQFAGASVGVYPLVVGVEKVEVEGSVKFKINGFERANPVYMYRATVELRRLSDDKLIGRATASCSNQEYKKKSFDEYAIESMAQTRAIGKAFRLTLGWIVKLAGYEGTPAEEATDMPGNIEVVEPTAPLKPIDEVQRDVNAQLEALDSTDRIRTMKNTVGKINTKNFTEHDWRRLDDEFTLSREEAEPEQVDKNNEK